jgi:hypothetical protein
LKKVMHYWAEWSKKILVQNIPKFMCYLNRELDRDTNCKSSLKEKERK